MPEVNFGRQMMADAKFFESYSRYIDELDRYETWDESVSRVMDTHRTKYKDKMSHRLSELILEAENAYKNEEVLGSQRALQFGGEQLLSHEIRLYNCGATYIDRPPAFGETMYSLLGGCGIGFSVQKHHVDKLPKLQQRGQRAKTYTVEDSIEGWSHAFDVLLSSYFADNQVHQEYKKCHVAFDLSNIRLKGAKISGGFKAPGPEPLRKALTQVESLLNKVVQEGGVLRPIHVYDIIMYMADAVLSGGVRRSATLALFSPDDEEMMSAKTGNWFIEHPQRARSNNSALLLRDEVTLEDMQEMTEKIKQFGEPGFILSDSTEFLFNPCAEISFMPVTKDEKSGFQFCVSYDTKLITKDGIEIIGEVAENEESVEIWNGKQWSTVKPIKTGTNKNLYRVSFGDGSYLDCTENHRFLVKNRFQKEYEEIETLKLKEMLKTSKYSLHVPRTNIVPVDNNNDNSHAYDYGYILGDGCATKFKNNEYRVPFAGIFGDVEFPLSGYKGKKLYNIKGTPYFNHYFDTVDKEFSFDLKYTEGLPKCIFSWSTKSIKDFIAGWLDSDGSAHGNGARIYGEEHKIRDLQLLLTKIGVNSSVNLMSKKGSSTNYGVRKRDVWYAQISDTKTLYSNRMIIESKPVKSKGKYQTIRSVELLEGKHDSYCFEEHELHQAVFNNVLTKQCNLSEINGGISTDKETFFAQCRNAAILGTLQAGYTNFKFMTKETIEIVKREALLGVSITGWMENPHILFDEEILAQGAQIVKDTNKEVAELLGINQSARTTCAKPSGNACQDFSSKIRTNKGVMTLFDAFSYMCDGNIDLNSLHEDQEIKPYKNLYVYDKNNEEALVTSMYVNGYDDCYEVEFEDGNIHIFTANHKLLTTNGWKLVSEITDRDEIVSYD